MFLCGENKKPRKQKSSHVSWFYNIVLESLIRENASFVDDR